MIEKRAFSDDGRYNFVLTINCECSTLQVNAAAGLSPGNKTIKRADKLTSKKKKKSAKTKTKEWKKRRIELKKSRASRNAGKEIREGTTYESEIGIIEHNYLLCH